VATSRQGGARETKGAKRSILRLGEKILTLFYRTRLCAEFLSLRTIGTSGRQRLGPFPEKRGNEKVKGNKKYRKASEGLSLRGVRPARQLLHPPGSASNPLGEGLGEKTKESPVSDLSHTPLARGPRIFLQPTPKKKTKKGTVVLRNE